MKHFFLAAPFFTVGAFAQAVEPAPLIPIEQFVKHAQFDSIKISPTGAYLAATAPLEDKIVLVILRRSDMQPTGHFNLAGKTQVDEFWWVNDERLLISVAEKFGGLDRPMPTGELYATNFDGTRQEILVGARAATGEFSKITTKKNQNVGADLIDTLRNDDKFVLISVYPRGNDEGTYPTIERLNVYTGARSKLATAPVINAFYATDRQQQVRFAMGSGSDNKMRLYYRVDNDAKWEIIHDESSSGIAMYALGFNGDGSKAYFRSEEKSGPDSIYSWDPKSREKKLIARDDNVDPFSLVQRMDDSGPFGVVYSDGLPRFDVFEKDAPEAKLLKMLMASFPGHVVGIGSFTKDGNELTFSVSSDRNPGDFYLFNQKDKKATYLLSRRQWIEPDLMAEMKPISYTARDGLVIHGYLTVPNGSDGKNLPLIVNPHGGPIGPFDGWRFNFEVQLLANRGYAVLQVNYRGSGNYGRAFERAGYQQWGGTMQDDLTDATHWAIKEGIADKNRICMYGGSYGGYASAMALVKEPDLYKCAVGYVGVYDMPMMYTRGDIKDRESGKNFLKEALGANRAELVQASPSRNVDKIKAPIFIVAGGEDQRAPLSHSKALRDALEKAGKPYEWLVYDFEGHGFYKEEHNLEYYSKMLTFFEKHIGKGVTGTVQVGAAQSTQ